MGYTPNSLYGVFACVLITTALGHGTMIWPPQRGITNGFKFAHVKVKVSGDQSDWHAHFPAGDKSTAPGAAMISQKQAMGGAGWVPYDPFNPNFRWRANVCGDINWGNDHMRGGKFYNGGKIHATYDQGGTISVDLAIVAHHNGYIELFVCDVAKCGGEISKQCFRQKSCYKLKRAWDSSCESRNDWKCAPIDPNYPSRFYLPCGKSYKPGGGTDVFGHGKIKFKLPDHLNCEHCVVQWYWVSANACNPPGVRNFFKSDRAPKWHNCPGQGEAKGGVIPWDNPCGGQNAPEEYYTCADIKIKSKWGGGGGGGRQTNTWGTAQNNWVGARGRRRPGVSSLGGSSRKSSWGSGSSNKKKWKKKNNNNKNRRRWRRRNNNNWNNRPSQRRTSRIININIKPRLQHVW